ncbi:TPR repeat-containing protein [[Leptolyngbya] sp. PCC 7376]|nr:TPR repeat-containing protein [[Leptolyngbya] sp. PCC 7376]
MGLKRRRIDGLRRSSSRIYHRLKFGLLGFGLVILLAAIPFWTIVQAASPSNSLPEATLAQNEVSPLSTGQQLYDAGRYDEAIGVWQNALDNFVTTGDRTQQIMALNNLSAAYQAINQWPQAEQTIDQSLNLLTQFPQSSVLQAQALNTRASLWLHLGQAELALSTWKQAEQNYVEAQDTIGILGSQINQAKALQTLGFYRHSLEQLTQAEQELFALPDSTLKVIALRSLGKVTQLIGDPRDSYNLMAQALAIAQRIDATPELSATYFSIGKLATEVESADIALAYFEKAETTALESQERQQAQLEQFGLLVKTQQHAQAEKMAPQLLSSLQAQSASRASIYSIVNFAQYASQLPNSSVSITELSQLLAQAIQFADELDDTRAESHALRQLGQLYSQVQQYGEAFELTEKSLRLARTTQSADVIAQSAWQLGRLLKQQNQLDKAIEIYAEAVTALQSLRGDLAAINQSIQFSYQEQVEPVYRELASLLLESETPEHLKQARGVLEDLQVAELDNFFREACLDLQANQIEEIDPTATVVYPIILPDRIATIYSKADDTLSKFEMPVDSVEIEQSLREFLSLLHPSADKTQRLEVSQKIYDWLIRPAEEQGLLTSDQPLVFVLDGLLRNIPVSALYDGQQYLIEKYPVALSPGLQLMQAQSLSQGNIKALVGGISEQRGLFSALPAVKTEVTAISNLVASTKLLNSEFTRNALARKLQAEQVDIVHLATHGQFSSDFSQTFFLTWDGVINIRELSELLQQREASRNQAINLLTLSACETAKGDNRASLGLAGLAVRSGARSTIATLWSIKDNVAAQIMTTFYDDLRQPGVSKAEALRQAQIHMLRDTDFSDPFFWSAYVLIGNWV